MSQATIHRDVPLIVVTFVCQHVHCVRERETDKIVEGSETDIHHVHYVWYLAQDLESEFEWRVVEMAAQRIFAIQ